MTEVRGAFRDFANAPKKCLGKNCVNIAFI